MPYTRDAALEFWYESDQTFLFAASAEVVSLYQTIYGPRVELDAMIDLVRDHPTDLPSKLTGREQALLRLATLQLEIIDKHFPVLSELQTAFEDFGQGVLFDDKGVPGDAHTPRRPVGRMIHMMDGTPDDCVGYHRWHAFIQAAVAVGADQTRWLDIDRLVALAWAIYSELDPREDAPNNPPLPAHRMDALRRGWLTADVATLNVGFLHYSGKFPDTYGSRRARRLDQIRYWHMQSVLREATAGSFPRHTGAGKFWELELSDFLKVQVYGHHLFASPGPSRGARSSLVKVLNGTLAGFPRMPLFRPPLSPDFVEFVEKWIDELELA